MRAATSQQQHRSSFNKRRRKVGLQVCLRNLRLAATVLYDSIVAALFTVSRAQRIPDINNHRRNFDDWSG
jgi:hypothetical protein